MSYEEQNPDAEFNLRRLLKVIKKCPRCKAEVDRLGGLRFTMDKDLIPMVEKAYKKWQEGPQR